MAKPVRKPLMAGNWKMNLHHLEAISLVQKLAFTFADADYRRVEIAVLPPFTDIRSVQTMVDGDKLEIAYGAQDLSPYDSGAYTGDISGAMLARLGCTYVVIGHSERREYHAETDHVVNAKVQAAARHGLVPILCVGERLDVRQAGGQVAHCVAQLDGAMAGVAAEVAATIVLAYEPVWAIGTGEVATPARRCAPAWPSSIREASPTESGSCTAARSRRRTPPGSWPSPTSTGPWSAARAWTRRSSPVSAALMWRDGFGSRSARRPVRTGNSCVTIARRSGDVPFAGLCHVATFPGRWRQIRRHRFLARRLSPGRPVPRASERRPGEADNCSASTEG